MKTTKEKVGSVVSAVSGNLKEQERCSGTELFPEIILRRISGTADMKIIRLDVSYPKITFHGGHVQRVG